MSNNIIEVEGREYMLLADFAKQFDSDKQLADLIGISDSKFCQLKYERYIRKTVHFGQECFALHNPNQNRNRKAVTDYYTVKGVE